MKWELIVVIRLQTNKMKKSIDYQVIDTIGRKAEISALRMRLAASFL